ncbi:MAG TPA: hypothetical protein VND23_00520 [Acidimicrobiales bacterium]|nr:hypothetical protein [Acidimicrobiales bacterium]
MNRRTARLARFLQRWWEGEQPGDGDTETWRRGRSAEQIASELRRDVHFEISQSTFLYRRPDETDAAEAVATLVPSPGEEDTALLVAAVVRAGERARRVRATTGAGAVVTVFALVLRNVLRGR